MVAIEYERIEIDHCIACSGVWFDSGELELLIERIDSDVIPFHPIDITEHNSDKKIKCPRCFANMKKVWFDSESKILIDSCHNGHGIWFDRGELNLILGASESGGRIKSMLSGIFRKRGTNLKGEIE